jgi:hypothetical protein
MPSVPSNPGNGLRQQRAAEIRRQMESERETSEEIEMADDLDAADSDSIGDDDDSLHEEPICTILDSPDSPVGEGTYIVRQGECILSIAISTGHHWESIWNHSQNTQLREVRRTPHVLLPGDRLTIPTIATKQESGETEVRHRFRRRGTPVPICITLRDWKERPYAGKYYELRVGDETVSGDTDAQGCVRAFVPAHVTEGHLSIWLVTRDRPPSATWTVQFGSLNPVNDAAGLQARLKGLGHYSGPIDGVPGNQTVSALLTFQAKHGLPATGQLTDETRELLLQKYGS